MSQSLDIKGIKAPARLYALLHEWWHRVYLGKYLCKMRGHNHSAWIRIGETVLCGKSCCGGYWGIHLVRIQKGNKILIPCRFCIKGLQSEIQFCRDCGQDKVRFRCQTLEVSKRAVHTDLATAACSLNLHLERRFVTRKCIPYLDDYG